MAELTLDQQKALAKARARLKLKSDRGEPVGTFANGEGTIYQRADGSYQAVSPAVATVDQDVIKRIMEGDSYQAAVQSQADQDRLANRSLIIPRATQVARGVPFVGSYMDEALGLVSPKGAEEMRRDTAAMERERPVETAALNVAGGLASAVAAAPYVASNVPQWFSALPRWQRALLTAFGGGAGGALEGAIWGSGEGTTTEERLANAQSQGLLGGLFGAGAGAAAPFAADLVDSALRAMKRVDVGQIASRLGISKAAAKVLRRHLDVDDFASAREVLKRAGDDAMLGELTPGARSALDATAARGGNAANIVDNALNARMDAANSTVRSAADDVLGPPPAGLRSAADEISARTAPARRAAYTEAYSTPIDYASGAGRRVEEVVDRVPSRVLRQAVEAANEEIQSNPELRRAGVRQILFEIGDDGKVTFREMPNAAQLDQIKRGLQETAARNTDAFGRLDAAGLRYNRLADELRDATIEATGGADGPYARALSIGGDKIAEDQALKLGSDILNQRVTREEVVRQMRGASQDARNAAKVGLRQEIDEIMENVRAVASDPNVEARQVNALLRKITSPAARTKIRIILGNEEADRLFKELDRAFSGMELRAAVSENSKTARRLAFNQDFDAATQRGMLSSAAAGEAPASVKGVIQLLTGETEDALAFRRSGVADEIARVLTERRGRSAEVVLDYVNRAIEGQRLTDAQAAFVANYLVNTGVFSGVPQLARANQ